ncbi:MAG: hypothetical protein EA361_18880 [Bacteroidetes bacterium]|nr:MAG: hypothetical protein EA361_18880 [Bacteroidota bacterium]
MKQIVTIAFLLLANAILLVHDVIPHHHHDTHVCFEHHACGSDHSHETENQENDDACCLLADLQILAPASSNHEINCPCCSHDPKHGKYTPVIIHEVQNALVLLFTRTCFRQNPTKSSFYLTCAVQSFGLRAPPLA